MRGQSLPSPHPPPYPLPCCYCTCLRMTCRYIIFCSSYHFDLSTTNSVAAPKYDPWGPVNINGCSTSTLKHVVLGTLTDHNKLQNPNKMEFVNLAGSWQDSIKSMLKIPLFNSLFSLSLLSRESFGSWISASKITYKTGRYLHCIFQAISFRWYALNMLAWGSGSLILNKLYCIYTIIIWGHCGESDTAVNFLPENCF